MQNTQLLTTFFGEKSHFYDHKTPKTTRFYYINDAAGNMRWVFPENCKINTLLSLYNSAGWRGQVRTLAYKGAFLIGKTNWVASGSFWAISPEKDLDFALFTGTPGRNRKMVISYQSQHFEKIPLTPEATILTQHELVILEKLATLELKKMIVPSGKKTNRNGLIQNNVRPNKVIPTALLTARHETALQELSEKTLQLKPLKSTFFYKKIKENLTDFEQCEANEFTQKAANLYEKIKFSLEKLENNVDPIPVSLAHGDFTPWNCFLPANAQQPLALYDWELALEDAPVGFDALHFTIQSGILLQRLPLSQLKENAQKSIKKTANAAHLLSLYVVYTAAYYLPLYARQKDLHGQVWWLLEAWEGLLNLKS
jgi:hypothetical protein